MPYREISHSAKIGTVAGSIDLAGLTGSDRPEAGLLPGTIPQAHRGIIFVDEVNRLADTAPELADILLDVMGTKPGRIQIEETGLPGVDLPVSVSVWAASNPDEDPGPLGDIRKQLSDRFDFLISMERPTALATVRDILRTSRERQAALAFTRTALPPSPCGEAGGRQTETTGLEGMFSAGSVASEERDWTAFREALGNVRVPDPVEDLVASLYVDFGLESLRGVEAVQHGARTNCALEGRLVVTLEDVTAVAPGALQHRLDVSTFARIMDYLAEKVRAGQENDADRPPPGARDEDGPPGEPALTAAAAPGQICPTGKAAASPAATVSSAAGDFGKRAAHDAGDPADPSRGAWSVLRSFFGASRRRVGSRAGSRARSDQTRSGASGASGKGMGSWEGASGGSPEGDGSATGAGARARLRVAADGRAVAPLHSARPLAEILRDMDLGGGVPPGPRLT